MKRMHNSESGLSQAEMQRYARQLGVPEIGLAGQRRLKAASVLIVGVGGLGSVVSLYLAAAGVGRLGIVDHDRIELENLNRQILYCEISQGARKVDAACAHLKGLNSEIKVEGLFERMNAENAQTIAGGFDLLVDCSDNFATRYLVNDLCVLTHRVDIYGAVAGWGGQLSTFDAQRGPCYRCLFRSPTEFDSNRAENNRGVLGTVAGTIGTLQAAEVVKQIVGTGEPLIGRMLTYSALDARFEEVNFKKDPGCSICGTTPTRTSLADL